jgi:hypothetical protein
MRHLSAFLLLLLAGAVPAAHAQLGIAAGANFDSYSDVQTSAGTASLDGATGYHVGLFYDLTLGPIGVRPGVYYVDLGEIEVPNGALPPTGNVLKVDLSLVEIPIDLRYRVLTPLAQPYLSAGPVFRIANSEDEDGAGSARDFTVAGAVGAGIDLGLPFFSPFLEIRYQFGVDGLVDEFEVAGQPVSPDDGTNLNSFMVRLGVTF